MADLKVGDVVKLKSGSVNMTVTKVRLASGRVECMWFPDGVHSEKGYFPADALELAQSGGGAPVAGL